MNNVPRTTNTLPRTNHLSCLSHRILPRHLYICREPSTNQLLFMQNKPNFRKSQMNLKFCKQTDYEYKRDWTIGQNKPNSNPIKPNLTYPQRGKTEVRCRFSEVRYLSSVFCFLSSVHGPQDRNRLRLQWHFRHSSRKSRNNLLDLRVLI